MTYKGTAIRGGARKRKTIVGQFAPRLTEMLESPAYRVLSLSGHRALARLEIELGRHAGHDNGKLPTTFDDFEKYGIHRHAIGPAVREAAALGFIEIMQAGRAGNAEWRRPTLYRLTYRHQDLTNPTDEWRSIQTIAEAEALAFAARKKKKSSGGKRTMGRCGKRTSTPPNLGAETTTTGPVRKPPLLSISREDSANVEDPPSVQPSNEQAREGGVAQIGDTANVILLAAQKNQPAKKSAVRS